MRVRTLTVKTVQTDPQEGSVPQEALMLRSILTSILLCFRTSIVSDELGKFIPYWS